MIYTPADLKAEEEKDLYSDALAADVASNVRLGLSDRVLAGRIRCRGRSMLLAACCLGFWGLECVLIVW